MRTASPFDTRSRSRDIRTNQAAIKTPHSADHRLRPQVIFCVRGVVSPVLANVALDGMERLFGAEDDRGRPVRPSLRRGPNHGIGLVRYADDRVPRTY